MLVWGPPYLHIKKNFLFEGKKSVPLCKTHLWRSGAEREVVLNWPIENQYICLICQLWVTTAPRLRTQVGRKVTWHPGNIMIVDGSVWSWDRSDTWHNIQRHCGTEIFVGGKKGRPATYTIRAVLSTDFVTRVFWGIFLCSQSGDYPWEDLAKSGYKPEVKFKNLIILPYFWLHNENQI
jgi:hypothetical protein